MNRSDVVSILTGQVCCSKPFEKRRYAAHAWSSFLKRVGFVDRLRRFWRNNVQDLDITVVAGSAVLDSAGYDNVLVAIDRTDGRILYSERMPVPVSMWLGSARAHFFANPVVEIAGKPVAPLICYEQLIVWPILQSMLSSPDLVLAVGKVDVWDFHHGHSANERRS